MNIYNPGITRYKMSHLCFFSPPPLLHIATHLTGMRCHNSNPNEHHRQDTILAASKERNRFKGIVWDEYDPVHQKYLEIGEWGMDFLGNGSISCYFWCIQERASLNAPSIIYLTFKS